MKESSGLEVYHRQWDLVDMYREKSDAVMCGPAFKLSSDEVAAMKEYYSTERMYGSTGEARAEFEREYPDVVDLAKSGVRKIAKQQCLDPESLGL